MNYFPTYQAEVRKTSDITKVGVCLRTFYLDNHFKDKAVAKRMMWESEFYLEKYIDATSIPGKADI